MKANIGSMGLFVLLGMVGFFVNAGLRNYLVLCQNDLSENRVLIGSASVNDDCQSLHAAIAFQGISGVTGYEGIGTIDIETGKDRLTHITTDVGGETPMRKTDGQAPVDSLLRKFFMKSTECEYDALFCAPDQSSVAFRLPELLIEKMNPAGDGKEPKDDYSVDSICLSHFSKQLTDVGLNNGRLYLEHTEQTEFYPEGFLPISARSTQDLIELLIVTLNLQNLHTSHMQSVRQAEQRRKEIGLRQALVRPVRPPNLWQDPRFTSGNSIPPPMHWFRPVIPTNQMMAAAVTNFAHSRPQLLNHPAVMAPQMTPFHLMPVNARSLVPALQAVTLDDRRANDLMYPPVMGHQRHAGARKSGGNPSSRH
ncbi:hypothetical protein M3P05_19525 [Sansalvadorimonas sp. 2012CJ34-2]|uniref:Uncharacterized protein n=1 Tax=Parendozoicomonas callyspongiae TaxID=2942213 RepID=A0ABT0PLJ4_9GAMM|nr:hypothetical protein [Sansalvadorimonas sp. 2012CJ34-2]MCL6272116.1 hypothetical protein [Sansalvadorimonas sp. 2012CJ34-2]